MLNFFANTQFACTTIILGNKRHDCRLRDFRNYFPTEWGEQVKPASESDERAARMNGWPREAWTEVSRQFESGLVPHLNQKNECARREKRSLGSPLHPGEKEAYLGGPVWLASSATTGQWSQEM